MKNGYKVLTISYICVMEILVEKQHRSRSVKVYLIEQIGSTETLYGQKDGVVVAQASDINDPEIIDTIPPLFEMNDRFFNQFISAVVDFASREGVKTQNEHALIGKIQVMQSHIDMLTKIVDKSIDKFTR